MPTESRTPPSTLVIDQSQSHSHLISSHPICIYVIGMRGMIIHYSDTPIFLWLPLPDWLLKQLIELRNASKR